MAFKRSGVRFPSAPPKTPQETAVFLYLKEKLFFFERGRNNAGSYMFFLAFQFPLSDGIKLFFKDDRKRKTYCKKFS